MAINSNINVDLDILEKAAEELNPAFFESCSNISDSAFGSVNHGLAAGIKSWAQITDDLLKTLAKCNNAASSNIHSYSGALKDFEESVVKQCNKEI